MRPGTQIAIHRSRITAASQEDGNGGFGAWVFGVVRKVRNDGRDVTAEFYDKFCGKVTKTMDAASVTIVTKEFLERISHEA